jgi:hypothetical protein
MPLVLVYGSSAQMLVHGAPHAFAASAATRTIQGPGGVQHHGHLLMTTLDGNIQGGSVSGGHGEVEAHLQKHLHSRQVPIAHQLQEPEFEGPLSAVDLQHLYQRPAHLLPFCLHKRLR